MDPILEPHSRDSTKLLVGTPLSNSKAYVLVFLCVDEILDKVEYVVHNQTEAYYKCLLSLPKDKLIHINAAATDPQLLCDAAQDEGEEDGREHEDIIAPAIDWAADELRVEALILRHMCAREAPEDVAANYADVNADGVRVEVHTTWSHQCGKLRFWVQCPNANHHRCFKYTFVDLYESELACARYLVAWALHGPSQDEKLLHRYFDPTADDLAAAALLF